MRIVVTGGDGFIGRNLRLKLSELGYAHVRNLTIASSQRDWSVALQTADVVYHLAGVNRANADSDFYAGNAELTERVCAGLSAAGRRATVVISSSIQVATESSYGRSKLAAETSVERYASETGARGCILRLPNVFGKWAQPNYNSAVATFCHNIVRGLPIEIHDSSAPLTLMHVDDAVSQMVSLLPPSDISGHIAVSPVYHTTVGEVAAALGRFARDRANGRIDRVGVGFMRALYSTFISYLPPSEFAYSIHTHEDARGVFGEIIRTADSGQMSYFTAHPGVTRGEHYHHTKTEKFLVVQGKAVFSFRHLVTGEIHALEVTGEKPQVIDTSPGWVHKITNVGETELVVLVWANENFDPTFPDTYPNSVET